MAADNNRAGSQNRRSDGERTRERVLEVALPLFARHGYAGTSIRRIARAAEVNVATLAYHFGDKDGLYTTVVQRMHEDLEAAFPSAEAIVADLVGSEGGLTIDRILRRMIEEGWAFCVSHREHNRLLLRHVLDAGALPDIVIENWTNPLMDRAVGALQLARPDLPAARIRLLVSAIQHLMVRWVLEDPAQWGVIVGMPPESPDVAGDSDGDAADGVDVESRQAEARERMGTAVVDFLERVARAELGLSPS